VLLSRETPWDAACDTSPGRGRCGFSCWISGDHGTGAALVGFHPKPNDIEGAVAKDCVESDALDVPLARQQDKAQEVAQRIHHGHDFRGQAAARAADGLILSPAFAPLAFWRVETMVPSIRAYSRSGSPDNRLPKSLG